MMDDIIDESDTRNNRKSWYKFEDVELTAVYDATIMLEYALIVLKQFASQRDIYYVFLKNLHAMFFGTYMAEHADTRHKPRKYSNQLYNLITDIKSQNSIVFAVWFGMLMAGITDEKVIKLAKHITGKMARLFQDQVFIWSCSI